MGPPGIRVNSVAPGVTEIQAAVGLGVRLVSDRGTDVATARIALMNSLGGIPLGRPARSAEFAELIAFLAWQRAAVVTGCEYVTDGGGRIGGPSARYSSQEK